MRGGSKTYMRRDVLTGAAGSLLAATSAHAQEHVRPGYTLMSRPAPLFSLPGMGGGACALSDYLGRVLILTFGGLWCPPCIVEGPELDRLAALAAADADIDFLYLQCGPEFGLYTQHGHRRPRPEDAEHAYRLYFTENRLDYPVAFDLSRRRDVARSFSIDRFPTHLVIGRDGVIRAAYGSLHGDGVRELFSLARGVAEGEASAV